MFKYLSDFFESVWNLIIRMQIYDFVDIILLAGLTYMLLKLMKETRAEQLLKGIGIFIFIFLLIKQFDTQLKAMNFILENFFQVGIIAVIIMFQPELRRVLEKMGRTKVSNIALNFDNDMTDENISAALNEIIQACLRLSRSATGALIVLERQTKLGEQVDTGTVIKATTSTELLCNIFYPNTPLHDGAVIVRNGMILAAGCFLPKPQKEQLVSKELGSRHRAAIGMSEVSDAVIVVVSEETGIISVAENGTLTRGFTKDSLHKLLYERFIPDPVYKRKKTKRKAAANKEDKTAKIEQSKN